MNCISCDSGSPAHVLGIALHESPGEFLCPPCLLYLLRQRARWRCQTEGCGRRLLLGPDRICAWCALGQPVSEDITTEVHPVKVLRGAAYLAARDAVKPVEPDELQNTEDVEDP